ncbi:uncharacterized protein SPSK_07916 [Sporothrix schenckii 1099-18]|uniref:Uncharacterized protein n=1 Tax=Sporothrix schenckii 1099-18 TaxID=1397361 RepID=A0A0F2MK30_SPOSC|nr:uncharacterized protein SPSK_07916 [Sporothrix schenckii 1099-18]KJR88536.1 hypothetical protein SPSK_07916 [Sporothrix schenckii 1099-18]
MAVSIKDKANSKISDTQYSPKSVTSNKTKTSLLSLLYLGVLALFSTLIVPLCQGRAPTSDATASKKLSYLPSCVLRVFWSSVAKNDHRTTLDHAGRQCGWYSAFCSGRSAGKVATKALLQDICRESEDDYDTLKTTPVDFVRKVRLPIVNTCAQASSRLVEIVNPDSAGRSRTLKQS